MELCKKMYEEPLIQNSKRNAWERLEPILGKHRKQKFVNEFKKGFLTKCTKHIKTLRKLKGTRRFKK